MFVLQGRAFRDGELWESVATWVAWCCLPRFAWFDKSLEPGMDNDMGSVKLSRENDVGSVKFPERVTW